MIHLYGHPVSTCTRKVLMTLAETETPFEISTLDFAKAEHKGEAHLARQPFGQMPALEDDGFRMYESRAMARYIAQKANSPLLPSDLRARATMEQWISIETSNFSGHAMKFVYEHVFKRAQTPEVLAAAEEAVTRCLTVMEQQLAAQPFIAGAAFTLADITFMPYFEYTMMTPAKALYDKFPAVQAWWATISGRPTWQKIAGR